MSSCSFMGCSSEELLLLFKAARVRIPHTKLPRPATRCSVMPKDSISRWRQLADRAVRTTAEESNQQQEDTRNENNNDVAIYAHGAYFARFAKSCRPLSN